MANEQLDSFLASEAQEATAQPAQPAASEAPLAAPAPKQEAKPQAEPKAAAATPETDDAEPPQPLDGEPVIPRRAYEDERRKRQDWKEKAARLEGENAAMRRQMEEAQRAPVQPMPPLAPIDPAQDPVGYNIRIQQVMLNERLNNSEMMLREKIGDDKVSEYVNDFKQMAQADQTLFGKLYSQVHPYNWMVREVDRLRMLRDVGDDPAAYRTKIETEARAKWEAEAAAKPAPVSPAAGMQPSLATARSVAGRTSSTWSGEPSLEDVLAPIQNRKNTNGQTRRF
jgi:hypothetical protein